MSTLQCTQKLLSRLKVRPAESLAPASGALGNWHANLLFPPGGRLVLAASDRTLLPVLLPGKDLASLGERFPRALEEILVLLRVPQARIAEEVRSADPVAFARTANRRVLGIINDFGQMMKFMDLGRSDLRAVALQLAQSPCSPIGMQSPDDLTAELLGAPRPERRWRPLVSMIE